MKTLLEKINEKIEQLADRDVEGHVWWGRFKDMVIEHELEYELAGERELLDNENYTDHPDFLISQDAIYNKH